MRCIGLWQSIATGGILTGVVACGTSGNGSLFEGGSGHAGSGTAGSIAITGGSGGNQYSSSTGSGGGNTTGPVNSTYPCPGCPPFPAGSASSCSPSALPSPTLVYPPDGVLLPPNMNVLEVQFVPNSSAKLFEVDFSNSITSVKVVDRCIAVPDVRRGPSRGCGITLPQAAWNDIANTNRDGDPVKVSVRATDGTCVSTSADKVA